MAEVGYLYRLNMYCSDKKGKYQLYGSDITEGYKIFEFNEAEILRQAASCKIQLDRFFMTKNEAEWNEVRFGNASIPVVQGLACLNGKLYETTPLLPWMLGFSIRQRELIESKGIRLYDSINNKGNSSNKRELDFSNLFMQSLMASVKLLEHRMCLLPHYIGNGAYAIEFVSYNKNAGSKSGILDTFINSRYIEFKVAIEGNKYVYTVSEKGIMADGKRRGYVIGREYSLDVGDKGSSNFYADMTNKARDLSKALINYIANY